MKRMTTIVIMSLLALGLISGCSGQGIGRQREMQAQKGDSILVGVPVPLAFARSNTRFLEGLALAKAEINVRGIRGKKLELEIVDDQGNFKTAVDVAQRFSANPRMLAVIGHWYSDVCIPVSSIYEDAEMLTLVPTVSNPSLTDQGYRYVFQSIASDKQIARTMCNYARRHGYKRVAIYYEESTYGERLATEMEKAAAADDLTVVDRSSGLVTPEQIEQEHDKWEALDFDAVLLALNMPEAGTFISRLRAIDQNAALIGADGLDVSTFIKTLGQDAEGVVIATAYNPDQPSPALQQFTRKYRAKYREEPDIWAIQGYQSLYLLAHAIEASGSYSPAVLANYLRRMPPLPTVLGSVHFNQRGEIQGVRIYTKVVVNGRFQPAE
jgi:branched-chain amino acid transport system substrate-binding protein